MNTPALADEQRIVARGIALGLATLLAAFATLYGLLPEPALAAGDTAARLGFACRSVLLACLPLLAMIAAVGNARFRSAAIDPLRGAESRTLSVDARVLDNSLQQAFVFAIASLALASVLPDGALRALSAAAIVFATARVAFWVGYRLHPLWRAPGMAATFYLNLGLAAAALWAMAT